MSAATPDACWITESYFRDYDSARPSPSAFRRDITLDGEVEGAVARVTAFAKYALYINGIPVSYGPARAFPEFIEYDTVDIGKYLKRGVNSFAAVVSPPTGFIGYGVVERMGFFLRADIRCGGKDVALTTDGDWLAREAGWFGFSRMMISAPTDFQEHFDGQSAPPDWTTSDPASDPERAWKPAFVLGGVGTPPWKHMRPRMAAKPVENAFTPPLVLRGTMSVPPFPAGCNMAERFNAAVFESSAAADACGTSFEYFPGKENVYVFDFGRTRQVRPGLSVSGFSGSGRFEFYYSQSTGERPKADRGFGKSYEGFCDSFTPPDGSSDAVWEALTPRGMRFLTLRIAGDCRAAVTLTAKTVDYPYGETLPLRSGDEVLDRIWEVSANTLRSSTTDTAVDTCARENTLWTFDALLICRAAYYTFGESAMWRKCLSTVADGVDADGIPKTTVPAHDNFMKLYDQNLYWVVSAELYGQATGDWDFFAGIYPAIRRFISHCAEYVTSEDLFVPPLFSWHWVDWASIDRRPYSALINFLFIMACDSAARLARRTGDAEFARVSEGLADRVRSASSRFFDASDGAFRTRIAPEIDVGKYTVFNLKKEFESVRYCPHSNALAWHARVGTEEERRRALAYLAGQLERWESADNRYGPGWTELILSPLLDVGETDRVLGHIRAVYGKAAEAGVPTWGEGGISPNGIYNSAHGWGAAVNCVLCRIFGRNG